MTKHDIAGLDPELKRLWDAIAHEREMRQQQRIDSEKALAVQVREQALKLQIIVGILLVIINIAVTVILQRMLM